MKLADKLYNLRSLIHTPPYGWEKERIDDYFCWAEEVIEGLPWVNASLDRQVHEVIRDYWRR